MDCKLMINDFEGPMDLLLHLIKKSDIDIYDINIEDVTKQYLDFINEMEELNLNIASEYLVMAAELMEIKSYYLLPKKELDTEDEYEEDPREQLINRLLEYEKYKNITSSLKEYEQERLEIHSKEPYDLSDYIEKPTKLDESFSMDDLIKAFNSMLSRKELDKPLNTKITTKEYSVTIRSKEIKDILKKQKKIEFKELFNIRTKEYVVVTFLSVLNMARKQELLIKQDKNFDSIFLEEMEGI
ncbi:MAG TPA: segregation/condensation protein A [Bacilli bacterium]|nr:segregation/condensation protein A [Bacilli bacterium]